MHVVFFFFFLHDGAFLATRVC